MPYLQHGIAGLILLVFGVLAATAPELCELLAQEDFWVEWLTFGFFAVAGGLFIFLAVQKRLKEGWFAIGLGLFCLVVLGEEISWGQRLFGFSPPEIFLEHNLQQEANLHNFLQAILKPKWLNALVLVGWGILGPLLTRIPWSQHHLKKFPLILPPLGLLPWFAAGTTILFYPVKFKDEYIELLTGALFFVTALPLVTNRWRPLGFLLALPILTASIGVWSVDLQASMNTEKKIACARAEIRELVDAVLSEGIITVKLLDMDYKDKRVFIAVKQGYFDQSLAHALDHVHCGGVQENLLRRRYFMDPWSSPYWVLPEHLSTTGERTGGIRIAFYSFGPNRRRDAPKGRREGTDDIWEWADDLVI